ncbi:MAG: hypothetical protein JSU87_13265 [Gemmatimonadota bacterium]|nr:MAG: hypothetical protein JSU87_13265 [Gemmatimonadota bacterium]
MNEVRCDLAGHRAPGAQSGLLARRTVDAGAMGCSQLIVETAEETPEREAPSFRSMLRFGFRPTCLRPDYIH